MISPDIVENIGIVAKSSNRVNSFYGIGGSLHSFFSKRVDEINIGKVKLKDVKVNFGVSDPLRRYKWLIRAGLTHKTRCNIRFEEVSVNN